MKLYVETIGCKVNQYESACIVSDFERAGYENADDMADADVIVINTCTVTNRTDYKSRSVIKKAVSIKAENTTTQIVLTGCYSQRVCDVKGTSNWDGIDFVVDNNSKNSIVNLCSSKGQTRETSGLNFQRAYSFTGFSEMQTSIMPGRSRAYVKVQDGCDMTCTYCAVPSARGRSRSRDIKHILAQVDELCTHGYEEIVLGGINLGDYKPDFCELLYEIDRYDQIKHIRLSSIEPQLFTDKLINAISKIDKIVPHFHIPLQSGSDTLLKKHGRNYDTQLFRDLIVKLETVRPKMALGIDVIVGLPGETDELFRETKLFLKSIEFAYLHIFTYSKRSGTIAAKMPGQITGTILKERFHELRRVEIHKFFRFRRELTRGRILLSVVPEGIGYGTSDRYVTAYFEGHRYKQGIRKLMPVYQHKDGVWCVELDDD
jgi:threonylcarbamoyladenosine tRNA methylthiotransferase MtaB